MAAIANVKVIESMIEIPAAQYRKVDREVNVGDLIRFDGESTFVTRGGFYEVIRVGSVGNPQIIDNDGDEYDLCCDEYEVYEKVTSEEKRQQAEAERVKWAKIGREVGEYKAGDVVQFTRDTGSRNYRSGSIAILDSVNGDIVGFGGGYGGHTSWLKLIVPVEQRFDRKVSAE